MKKNFFVTFAILFFVSVTNVFSQTTEMSAENYERAETMLWFNASKYIDRSEVRPIWEMDGRFSYFVLTPTGREYVLINPSDGSRKTFTTALEISKETADIKVKSANLTPAMFRERNLSPDLKKYVFIKDWNLYVRDLETQKETQLTKDGVENFGYATDNAGWRKSVRPIVLWSPDSKKIATYQQDQRNVSNMYLVSTNIGEPNLQEWKYPLPQDKEIIKIHRVIIDVDSGKMTRLKMEPDARRGTLCDNISCT